jgi:integrase
MAIVRTPLKTDAAGKCTRWRVILYNKSTAKHEWHTVNGTRRDAEAFERSQKTRLGNGSYISKTERRTFGEVAALFLAECEARNRRTSTLLNYKSILDNHLLPDYANKDAGSIRKQDLAADFAAKLKGGSSVELVNRTIRVLKAVLNFALDKEMIERNPVTRFRPYEGRGDRVVKRGAFDEGEIRALLACARPQERALVGLLCFSGLRPGEASALRWQDVDLTAGTAAVTRNWDHRGRKFTEPKTAAGNRVVALSGWVVAELTVHKARTDGTAGSLVFANRNGKPMNPSNLRRDVWLPLRKRAKVRALDLYSLRHTFASLGRTAGESAFNVARMMGHSRSTLVDQVYAHSLQSGMASVAERVTALALGEQPKLRLIDGSQRDVRQPLDEGSATEPKQRATA